MFGRRGREARRQKALEEMLWLNPVDRERRIIAAVAAHDFKADEIEAVLRLVSRLDSLREMVLPPGGRLLGSPADLGYVPDEEIDVKPAEEPVADLVAIPIVADGADVAAAVTVGVGLSLDTPAALPGDAIPIDALESAERWLSRDRSIRQTHVRSRKERRALGPRTDWRVPSLSDSAPVSPTAEEPSIAWLRPS